MENITLSGYGIRLEPFAEEYKAKMYEVAQHEEIWHFTATSGMEESFNHWFEHALKHQKQKTAMPFVVIRNHDNCVVGSTRYYDISHDHFRLMIGYTWYLPAVWGTYVNKACKFLLLQNAFENWQFNRIELCTDSRNLRSRAAILKLGAKEEGYLRQHMVLQGGIVRDSIIFSILRSEWPQVKENLLTRLKRDQIIL